MARNEARQQAAYAGLVIARPGPIDQYRVQRIVRIPNDIDHVIARDLQRVGKRIRQSLILRRCPLIETLCFGDDILNQNTQCFAHAVLFTRFQTAKLHGLARDRGIPVKPIPVRRRYGFRKQVGYDWKA